MRWKCGSASDVAVDDGYRRTEVAETVIAVWVDGANRDIICSKIE